MLFLLVILVGIPFCLKGIRAPSKRLGSIARIYAGVILILALSLVPLRYYTGGFQPQDLGGVFMLGLCFALGVWAAIRCRSARNMSGPPSLPGAR